MSRTILYHDLSCLPVNSLKVSDWPYLGPHEITHDRERELVGC